MAASIDPLTPRTASGVAAPANPLAAVPCNASAGSPAACDSQPLKSAAVCYNAVSPTPVEDLPSRTARLIVKEGAKWIRLASVMFLIHAVSVFLESAAPLIPRRSEWHSLCSSCRWDWATFWSICGVLAPFIDCIDPIALAGLTWKLREGFVAKEEQLVRLGRSHFEAFDLDGDGHVTLEEYNKKRRELQEQRLAALTEEEAIAEIKEQFPVLHPLKTFFFRLALLLVFVSVPRLLMALLHIVRTLLQ